MNFWGAADLIANGDYAVGQWDGGGTHTGPSFSDFLIGSLPAATGRKMHFTGTTVLKVIKRNLTTLRAGIVSLPSTSSSVLRRARMCSVIAPEKERIMHDMCEWMPPEAAWNRALALPEPIAARVSAYAGIIWLNHHYLFERLQQVNFTLNTVNLSIMGRSTLIPFPAGSAASHFHQPDHVAAHRYSALRGRGLRRLVRTPHIHRRHLHPDGRILWLDQQGIRMRA